jgi:hypothetical protein
LNVSDLAREESVKQVILHKKDSISRAAKFLAREDLPAAIFQQKKINFAEVLMRLCS